MAQVSRGTSFMDGKRLIPILCILGIILLIVIAIVLFPRPAALQVEDIMSEGLFVYPGTQWNMTPEEVRQALDLNEEHFKQAAESDGDGFTDRVYLVEKSKLSGLLSDVYFWFRAYGESSDFGLKSVSWIFDEAADLEPLKRDLEASFGNASRIDAQHSLLYWDSDEKLVQYINDECVENVKSLSGHLFERIENEAAASLVLVDGPDRALPMATLPSVTANANMIILSSSLSDVMQIQEGAAPAA